MARLVPLLLLALLTGCVGAAPGGRAADAPRPTAEESGMPASTPSAPQTVTLDVGARATLADGSQLTYLRLVNDSRCPPDVQCVWAGDAEIQVRWQAAGGRAQDAALHTSPLQGRQTETTFGPHRVALEALERGIVPKATLRITPAGD